MKDEFFSFWGGGGGGGGGRGAHFSLNGRFDFYNFCVGRVQMEGPLFVFFPDIK